MSPRSKAGSHNVASESKSRQPTSEEYKSTSAEAHTELGPHSIFERVSKGVTFDFGQVLASFDPAFLVLKLSEHGIQGDAARFAQALPAGWDAYGRVLKADGDGTLAWKALMRTLLVEGVRGPSEIQEGLVDWLFADQRERNLWRKPVCGMIALARALRTQGVPVGVVSNSEGRLSQLIAELGWASDFDCVADSGVLGWEKPNPKIFQWAAQQLRLLPSELVHIGDSWAADVEGALEVGASVVWFVEGTAPAKPLNAIADRPIWIAHNVDEVRKGIAQFGFQL